jgi:hypothetical protein
MAFKYINLQLNFHNFIIIIEGINCNTNHITFDQIAEDFLNKIKKLVLMVPIFLNCSDLFVHLFQINSIIDRCLRKMHPVLNIPQYSEI